MRLITIKYFNRLTALLFIQLPRRNVKYNCMKFQTDTLTICGRTAKCCLKQYRDNYQNNHVSINTFHKYLGKEPRKYTSYKMHICMVFHLHTCIDCIARPWLGSVHTSQRCTPVLHLQTWHQPLDAGQEQRYPKTFNSAHLSITTYYRSQMISQ